MLQELNLAWLIHRAVHGPDATTLEHVLTWGSRNGAKLLGLDEVGEIKVGMAADLVLAAAFTLRTHEAWSVHELLCEATYLAAPVCGWLTKLGGERRTWKQRFSVLTSCEPSAGQLRYYADESLSYLHGASTLPPSDPETLAAR